MEFVRRLIDLMLFRKGPQDLPGDSSTLATAALAYCIAQFIQILLYGPTTAALLQAVLATVLIAAYTHIVLRLRGLPHRFNQTASALFGSGALITLLMLAPTHALVPYLDSLRSASQASDVISPPPIAFFVCALLGFWTLAIYSFIYRHALEMSMVFGFAVTIVFEIVMLIFLRSPG